MLLGEQPEPSGVTETAATVVDSPAAGPAALRGSVLRSGGYALTVLLSLVAAPILIRHLGIAGFGHYTTVIAIVTIIAGLTDAGLVNIVLREWVTRSGMDRVQILRGLLGLRLELSAAGVAIGVIFAVVAGYPGILVVGTLIAGIGMALQTAANFLAAALQGELRFGWASLVDVIRQAVTVTLIVTLAISGAGLLAFLGATIPAGIITLVLAAALVRKRMPLAPLLRENQRWTLIRETLPYAAAIAVNSIYFRVTIVAMSLIATARQTGYFATSFKVTEVLVGVPALAVGAAFPILSRAAAVDSNRFNYATTRILELSLIAGGAMVLVVVLSAPWVIDVLAGSAGAPAAPVLQIQGLALVGTFIGVATAFPLLSLRRHAALLTASASALTANIVLTLVLVPLDQAKGAAIAAAISETCLGLVQLILLLREGRVKVHLVSTLAVILAGAAGAAPLLVSGLHPVLRTVAGLAIYVAVLALLGRVPPELRHAFEHRRTAESR